VGVGYDQRKEAPFFVFLFDNLIMQFGLKALAQKNVVAIYNGLKAYEGQPYGQLILRMVGLAVPPLRRD